MTENHIFIRSNWILQGKKWSKVPHIKRAVKTYFVIPPSCSDSIFPAKNLPIKQMMGFSVPSPVQSATADAVSPASYFSQTTPVQISESLLLHLQHLPIPSPRTIKKLLKVGHQAVLDGFKSVQYNHLARAVTTRLATIWFPNLLNPIQT